MQLRSAKRVVSAEARCHSVDMVFSGSRRLGPVIRSVQSLAILLPLLFAMHAAGHTVRPKLRHWEAPSPDPDRIVLTWNDDPVNSAAVTWRTDTSIRSGYAEIAQAMPAPRFDSGARRIRAVTQAVDLGQNPANEDLTVHYHTVNFDRLEGNTLYAYRVGDGKRLWSEWIQFRTATKQPAAFSFIYFGDAQNSLLSHWSRTIRAAFKQRPDAAFLLHAGDLVNRAHRDQDWAQWFKAGGWIHASVPVVPVTGNHEYRKLADDGQRERTLSLQWRAQFALPVESSLPPDLSETVYSFDYQGARFIVLNSSVLLETQVPWLEERLRENRQQWCIVSFHHPVFSSKEGRDNKTQRELWKPIFDKHNVDLILQGHDHTYARGKIPEHRADDADGSMVRSMYVNSVSGPKMYKLMEDRWDKYREEGVEVVRMAENTQFFQVVEIAGNRLDYRAYTVTGDLYDAFIIEKLESGQKRLIEGEYTSRPERSFENTIPYTRGGL